MSLVFGLVCLLEPWRFLLVLVGVDSYVYVLFLFEKRNSLKCMFLSVQKLGGVALGYFFFL